MRTRTAAILAITAAITALAGCSSGDGGKPESSKPATSSAASSTPALSKAEIGRRCANAVADQLANENETDDEDRPAACETLDDSEYMDAAFKGTQQANQAARDELERRSDEEAAKDAAGG